MLLILFVTSFGINLANNKNNTIFAGQSPSPNSSVATRLIIRSAMSKRRRRSEVSEGEVDEYPSKRKKTTKERWTVPLALNLQVYR